MTLAQIFHSKELTGKIFKLNDLLPRGARKFFILRSLRGRARVQIRPFPMKSGRREAELPVSGPRFRRLNEL